MPLALATLLYFYYAIYYLLGLIMINIIYRKQIALNQFNVYLFGVITTNIFLFFLYGETFYSIGFVKVLLAVNFLTILLIYISHRIFKVPNLYIN